MGIISQPTDTYEFPYLDLDSEKLIALNKSADGTTYEFGGKINPLSLQADDPNWPGQVDCSGYVRWALYHALGQPTDYDIPDGSANIHQWLEDNKFKASSLEAACGSDDYIRVGILSPDVSGIGHIFIVFQNETQESYGSHGVGSRVLADTPILHGASFYVLAPPK